MRTIAPTTLLLSAQLACAEIVEIEKPSDIAPYVNKASAASAWILFDIDFTLTEPSDPVWQMSTIDKYKREFKQFFGQLTPQERAVVPMLIVTGTPSRLVDSKMPGLIESWKSEGATVLGFTALDTSSLPSVGELPLWREKELARLAISFSDLHQSIKFTQFAPYRGSYPLFQNGVLYCNCVFGEELTKGQLLSAFLDEVGAAPSHLFFIDDTMDNLLSVQEELGRRGISFTGFKVPGGSQQEEGVTEEQWRAGVAVLKERLKELLEG